MARRSRGLRGRPRHSGIRRRAASSRPSALSSADATAVSGRLKLLAALVARFGGRMCSQEPLHPIRRTGPDSHEHGTLCFDVGDCCGYRVVLRGLPWLRNLGLHREGLWNSRLNRHD